MNKNCFASAAYHLDLLLDFDMSMHPDQEQSCGSEPLNSEGVQMGLALFRVFFVLSIRE
jgi:hypothetical protein